jgi:hypothetical protein
MKKFEVLKKYLESVNEQIQGLKKSDYKQTFRMLGDIHLIDRLNNDYNYELVFSSVF